MDIQSFLNQAAGSLGIGEDQASSAVGGILKMIGDKADKGDVSNLMKALPGAEALVGGGSSGGGLMGGLMGAAGIATTDDLLKRCAAPAGRKSTAEATGLSDKLILNWTNKADLMRISGVGPQFSELLEAAGVDTVKELRNRNAENLAATMEQVNTEKNLARTSPPAASVAKWVDAAKAMEPMITY